MVRRFFWFNLWVISKRRKRCWFLHPFLTRTNEQCVKVKIDFTNKSAQMRIQKVLEKRGMGVWGKGEKEPFTKGFSLPSPSSRRRRV